MKKGTKWGCKGRKGSHNRDTQICIEVREENLKSDMLLLFFPIISNIIAKQNPTIMY
jgi:hypothetical protein